MALLTAAPLASSLQRIPWPALALQRFGPDRLEWHGAIQLYPPAELTAPIKFRLYRFKRLRAELPFELRDVPLP
jgi:hypothetical protein